MYDISPVLILFSASYLVYPFHHKSHNQTNLSICFQFLHSSPKLVTDLSKYSCTVFYLFFRHSHLPCLNPQHPFFARKTFSLPEDVWTANHLTQVNLASFTHVLPGYLDNALISVEIYINNQTCTLFLYSVYLPHHLWTTSDSLL